jgi:hypothetical protein
MLSAKEVAIVYETLLTSPGMNDPVKIDLRIPRKNVLLLSKLIELGLSMKDEKAEGSLLSIVDATTLNELKGVADDMLTKGGLAAMNDKLNALYNNK